MRRRVKVYYSRQNYTLIGTNGNLDSKHQKQNAMDLALSRSHFLV